MIPKTLCRYRIKRQMLLLLAGFFFACLISPADGTELGGQILENTTWRLDGSPMILTGDIRIWNKSELVGTVELRIEPGVEVNLNGFSITAGDQADKDRPPNKGRIIAEDVRFFGKGNVVLACGEENKISNCLFEDVHLLLGGKTCTNSSGKIQNITMKYSDIIIHTGKWEVMGGKLLNGTISHQGFKTPGMSFQKEQYMNFFINLISFP
ncbi:MAG: hypothetical protein ABIK15_04210 [Pseudomonadota bacterium]